MLLLVVEAIHKPLTVTNLMSFLYIHNRHPHSHIGAEARLCRMTEIFGGDKNVPEVPRPSPKEPNSLLGSFARKMPFLGNHILKNEQKLDAVKLTHLTDDAQWIQAFRLAPAVLTKSDIPEALVTAHPHIAEFLRSIPNTDDRQKIYLEYIDYLIPEEQQIKLDISKLSLSPTQRASHAIGQVDKINAIFGALFGVEDWRKGVFGKDEAEAELIAKESLTNHYKNPKLNYPDTKNNNLELDVEAAVSYGTETSNLRFAATNPELLMNQVDESLLKGALQLGVIDRADLEGLQKDSEQKEHETNLAIGRASTKLESLTQATKLKQEIEAHGLREFWDDLPGAAKIAVFVLGGLALARKGWTRVVVGTPLVVLTGLYLLQKSPLLKQDDPIKHWDAALASFGKKIKGTNKELPGNNNDQLDVNDTIVKASFMMNYLSKFDREHMEAGAVGLALLAPVPMETLARNFIRNQDGSQWGLDFKSPEFKKVAKQGLKDMGWKESAYDKFFANEENVNQINEVIGNLFYSMAAKNPMYHDEARLVEDVHGQLERGGGLSNIGGKERFSFVRSAPVFDDLQHNANEAYIRMVGGGKKMADFDGRTLEQYIKDSMGFTAVIAAIEIPEEKPGEHASDDIRGPSAASDAVRDSGSDNANRGTAESDGVRGSSESGTRGTAESDAERGTSEGGKRGGAEGDGRRGAIESDMKRGAADDDVEGRNGDSDASRGNSESAARAGADNEASRGNADGGTKRRTENESRRGNGETARHRNSETSHRGSSENAQAASSESPQGRNGEAASKGISESARGNKAQGDVEQGADSNSQRPSGATEQNGRNGEVATRGISESASSNKAQGDSEREADVDAQGRSGTTEQKRGEGNPAQ